MNDDLYILTWSPQILNSVSVHLNKLWHQSLGHVSVDVLFKLPFKINFDCTPCDIHHESQQHKLNFNKNTNFDSIPFLLAYKDLRGPIKLLAFMETTIFLLLLMILVEQLGLPYLQTNLMVSLNWSFF